MSNELLKYEVVNPKGTAKASIIVMHGLGSNGYDFMPIVEEMGLPDELGIRFIFPHAPSLPVTLSKGVVMPAWYDVYGIARDIKEDEKGVLVSAAKIGALIEVEHALGIPYEKILLAGFSQGGALALATGLQYPKKLAGILALSTYLPIEKTVTAHLSPANAQTPILIIHGTRDPVVPYHFGRHAFEVLTQHKYPMEWLEYPISHDVSEEETMDIAKWLKRVLA